MRRHQQGFSLVEAMITLLVLSLGLLGLGRLQANLLASSADLHKTSDAYRLATSWLERFSYQVRIKQPASILTPGALLSTPATKFKLSRQLSTTAALNSGHIVVEWDTPEGQRSIRLSSAACTQAPSSDQVWLLPEFQSTDLPSRE
jgi:prepilin-type N-terminal cleavage/methylation domain-containing protein